MRKNDRVHVQFLPDKTPLSAGSRCRTLGYVHQPVDTSRFRQTGGTLQHRWIGAGQNRFKKGRPFIHTLPSGVKCVLGCRFSCHLLAILTTLPADVRAFIALTTNIRENVFPGILVWRTAWRERLVHTDTSVWQHRCLSSLAWHCSQSFVPVARSM
ncbi:MAG: hypothetical protein NTV84_10815 [Methanoregula sp.]|nr:hypothetical protein [Methanoregula sp.]